MRKRIRYPPVPSQVSFTRLRHWLPPRCRKACGFHIRPPTREYHHPMVQAILLACLSFAAPADTAESSSWPPPTSHGNATAWDYGAPAPVPGRGAHPRRDHRRLPPLYRTPNRSFSLMPATFCSTRSFAAFLAKEPQTPHPIVNAMNAMGYHAGDAWQLRFRLWRALPHQRRVGCEVQVREREHLNRLLLHTACFPSHAGPDPPRPDSRGGGWPHHARRDALGQAAARGTGARREPRPSRRPRSPARCPSMPISRS